MTSEQDPSPDFFKGVESVTAIRCLEHFAVPKANENASNGAECGGCIQAQLATAQANCDALIAIRAAVPKGFGNFQLSGLDPDNDQYAIEVDIEGDMHGHPLLESYYRPLLIAILAALRTPTTTPDSVTSSAQEEG